MFIYLLLNTREVVKDICNSTGIPDGIPVPGIPEAVKDRCKSIGAGLIRDYNCKHEAAQILDGYTERNCCR